MIFETYRPVLRRTSPPYSCPSSGTPHICPSRVCCGTEWRRDSSGSRRPAGEGQDQSRSCEELQNQEKNERKSVQLTTPSLHPYKKNSSKFQAKKIQLTKPVITRIKVTREGLLIYAFMRLKSLTIKDAK